MDQLSVGDGFRFGCGFLLAAFIAWLVMAVIGGILAAVFGAALGGFIQRISELSWVTQLIGLL